MRLPFKGILYILAVVFILTVASSLYIYRLVLPNVTQSMESVKQSPILVKKESATLHAGVVKMIVDRNIFNKTGEIPKDDMRDENLAYKGLEAIRSELPLKLNGVIFGGTVTSGIALIENTDAKKQNSYLVGDKVTKEAVLIEIQERKVILQVADHKEFIELVDRYLERGKRGRKKGSVGGATGKFGVGGAGKYSEEGFERDGNTISMSADYRQKLLTGDFAKVLQDAKAEPVYEGGELNGFRLTRIRADSVYDKGGLQNDDVVKEINGVSLVDTAQAIKLLNSLRGANEIEIGLNRGGSKMNVTIQVK
jgi:type II secretion system protein C